MITEPEWDDIPLWKKARLLMRVKNYGIACLECGESLTLTEKAAGKKSCSACWPDEIDAMNDPTIE